MIKNRMLQLSGAGEKKKAEENRIFTSILLPLNYDNICYKKSSQMILKIHLWLTLQNVRADPQLTLVMQRRKVLLSPAAEISFLSTLSL